MVALKVIMHFVKIVFWPEKNTNKIKKKEKNKQLRPDD